jgi:hypothetical protein
MWLYHSREFAMGIEDAFFAFCTHLGITSAVALVAWFLYCWRTEGAIAGNWRVGIVLTSALFGFFAGGLVCIFHGTTRPMAIWMGSAGPPANPYWRDNVLLGSFAGYLVGLFLGWLLASLPWIDGEEPIDDPVASPREK